MIFAAQLAIQQIIWIYTEWAYETTS